MIQCSVAGGGPGPAQEKGMWGAGDGMTPLTTN